MDGPRIDSKPKWLQAVEPHKGKIFYGGLGIAVAFAIIGTLAIAGGGAIIAGKNVWGLGALMKTIWVGTPYLVTVTATLALLPIIGFMVYGVVLAIHTFRSRPPTVIDEVVVKSVEGEKEGLETLSSQKIVQPFFEANKDKLLTKAFVYKNSDVDSDKPYSLIFVSRDNQLFGPLNFKSFGECNSQIVELNAHHEVITQFARLQKVANPKKVESEDQIEERGAGDEEEVQDTGDALPIAGGGPAQPEDKVEEVATNHQERVVGAHCPKRAQRRRPHGRKLSRKIGHKISPKLSLKETDFKETISEDALKVIISDQDKFAGYFFIFKPTTQKGQYKAVFFVKNEFRKTIRYDTRPTTVDKITSLMKKYPKHRFINKTKHLAKIANKTKKA